MRRKKGAAIFLLCAMLVSSAACSNDKKGEQVDTSSVTSTSQAETTLLEETKDAGYTSNLPDKMDLDGFQFRIMSRMNENDTSYGQSWSCHDMDMEEQTGELIDDAVYARNTAIEDRYNCQISQVYEGDVKGTLSKMVLSGDNSFQIATPPCGDAAALAADGKLVDLQKVPYIDLSKKYWDQGLTKNVTINGKTFFATGDISIMDNDATWVLYFNKDMIAKNDLVEPYDYVRNNTWTFDTFQTMIKGVTADLNGDTKFTEDDQYGLISHNGGFRQFQYFANAPCIQNVKGDYQITLGQENMASVVSKANEIINGDSTYNFAAWDTGVKMFEEDRALFYLEVLDKFRHLRGMETPFGVVPAPKLDENQENYTTIFDPTASLIAIPVTNPDLESTGLILEAMAADSVDTLTKAYYDYNLESKYVRDDDSIEMLDIILNNRIYDMAKFYAIGGIDGVFGTLIEKNSNDFASAYAKIENRATKALEKLLTKFAD